MPVPFFTPRVRRIATVFLTGVLLCNAATAMTLRELRALESSNQKQGENYANYFLVGVMEGVLEAHSQAVRGGAKPSICLNGRRLQPHMARTLFDTEMQRNAGVYEADMSVQLVMANALSTVYAC